MGNRPIYCGLPRTSIAIMRCTELVCKVCICFSLHLINLLLILLCPDVKGTGMTLTAIFLNFHVLAISPKRSLSTIQCVNYGMTSVLSRTLLYINMILLYNAFLSLNFFNSRSPMISNVPTFMSSLLLTCFIKLSREHLRITW